MKIRFKHNVILFFSLLFLSLLAWADSAELESNVYLNKTKLVSQQISLLSDRLVQAKHEITSLQHRQDTELSLLSVDRVNKQMLSQAGLDLSVAKSNSDSINIELSEAQQSITRLTKDIQEIENQLNMFDVFGVKVAKNNVQNFNELQEELHDQEKLLQLEKTREDYLLQLQKIADDVVQLVRSKHARIDMLLKSQTMMQLKQQQAKSELAFQQQQSYWLQKLNQLYANLNKLDQSKKKDQAAYAKLENEIFFANEYVNFTYLQMLIARYQDQIQQLKVSISRSGSITLLNKMGEQTQSLIKQVARVSDLLNNRMTILEKRKSVLTQANEVAGDYKSELVNLGEQYQIASVDVSDLNKQLVSFRGLLDQSLKQELSSRQGLPAIGAKGWWDLGAELWLMPSLTYHVIKSLIVNIAEAVNEFNASWWGLFVVFEIIWMGSFYWLRNFLARAVLGMPDHEYGHINLKWLGIKLLHRTVIDMALLGNVIGLLYVCGIPLQNFSFLIQLAFVWLIFKGIVTVARLCLVETLHDHAGHDVRLFHNLKWTFVAGGLITAMMVFVQQLPVIYEVKDLFNRLFLLFMLIVSVLLLRSWQLLPGLILPYIDDRHTYVRRIVRMVGLLIPLVLLVNSAIGLFGFVNFVLTISWYEGIFLLVLVGYWIVKGMLNEAMEYVSKILILHVTNGWLWTEAFLKPINKVLRVIVFLAAWALLFLLYGWDQQSPVVERLNKLLQYHLFDVLNTPITPWSILELLVLIAFVYWATRWTREFVYRLLLSRTRDMGVRNSIAILSQYAMIVLGAFICLRVLGIDFRALAVVAGALAFGVGFGLRDIANNFVCGFLLLIERPLRVGDTVTINGYEGDVIHIGGRAVTIRTWDHMEVLVPNAEIFTKTFTNWTARDNIVRTVIDIKISRHDKPEMVQSVVHDVLNHQKDVLKEPVPEVLLKELAEGMIEFEIRYYINLRQVKSRVSVRSEVLAAIWQAFEKEGIQPPYPHHEVFLKGDLHKIDPR